MKSSSLSDPHVIQKLNTDFIPLEINITDQGFPKEIPALALWEKAYNSKRSFQFGFATSVGVEPQGRFPLGTSGSGYLSEKDTSINYHPDKYLRFLTEVLDRDRRARSIAQDPGLTADIRAARSNELKMEILRSLQAANRAETP